MATAITVTTLGRSPFELSDLIIPFDAASQAPTDLAGVAADICDWFAYADALLLGWGYQVTTTLACETIAPVVTIDIRDYDGTSNDVEQDTQTIPDLTAAANAVVTRLFTPAVAVAEGRDVVLEHKTQGTGAAAAGACRVWAVVRFTGR